MKIRTDFVTNSSSSSFVLARKGEITQKQKDAIANKVLSMFFGKPVATNIEELKKFAGDNYIREEEYHEMEEMINDGMTIYSGRVDFEEIWDIADTYQQIWKEMEDCSDGNFKIIDGTLDY